MIKHKVTMSKNHGYRKKGRTYTVSSAVAVKLMNLGVIVRGDEPEAPPEDNVQFAANRIKPRNRRYYYGYW